MAWGAGGEGVRGSLPDPSTPNFPKTPPGALTIAAPAKVRRRAGDGGMGELGSSGRSDGEGFQKRGLLERALNKLPWSARWERNCWQRDLHVQRPQSGQP